MVSHRKLTNSSLDNGIRQNGACSRGCRGAVNSGQLRHGGAVVCSHAHERLIRGYPPVAGARLCCQAQVHSTMHLHPF